MINAFTAILAATSDEPSNDIVNKLLTWGPGGIVVLLFLLGLIVPKTTVDMWREQLAKEQEAHNKTREALDRAVQQGDAAREQANTLLTLLHELGHGGNRPGVTYAPSQDPAPLGSGGGPQGH
ncbi:hypothetical protein [Streptomyces sp. NPDC021020]|uniref:hypothetical protein n=1 Tax=Streptomyces sp. NPDC021020 TaxID=3365109 RepID=UPI0037BD22FB